MRQGNTAFEEKAGLAYSNPQKEALGSANAQIELHAYWSRTESGRSVAQTSATKPCIVGLRRMQKVTVTDAVAGSVKVPKCEALQLLTNEKTC